MSNKLPIFSNAAVKACIDGGVSPEKIMPILIEAATKAIVAMDWSKYNSIAEFVNAAQAAGVVVPASVLQIQTQSMELRRTRKLKLENEEEENEKPE